MRERTYAVMLRDSTTHGGEEPPTSVAQLEALARRRESTRLSIAARAMCGSVLTRRATACFNADLDKLTEIHMYIGGGILGTILIIALIVYLLRRA